MAFGLAIRPEVGAFPVTEPVHQRRTVYYSGRVQGVGFRFTARSIAQRYEVAGMVQNLDDGRVLLVAEGAQSEMDRFLTDLSETMGQFIHHTNVVTSPATGEFTTFSIER
ncbi:MAG TPA: acylphosphatase [Pirellulales bacterium]